MSLPVWPLGLRMSGAAGVSGGPQANVVSFDPDVGPPINRRRASVIMRSYSVSLSHIARTEYDLFQTFFHSTLIDGTLTFRARHPMTGRWARCKFIQSRERAYTETRVTATLYSLQFEMMVLNDISEPSAFVDEMWSVAPANGAADVAIWQLPRGNGENVTDIEYRLDAGPWVPTGGTGNFSISPLTNEQTYGVELRAVNAIGPSATSDVKSVTPDG